MRACLAILKDSFREALASRVLLIALLGIIAILALIAPFGLHEENALQLRRTELQRPDELVVQLAGGADEDGTPEAHLWSLLTEEQQQRIASLADPDASPDGPRRGRRDGVRREIVRMLNALLTRDEFHESEAWDSVTLSAETQELVARSDLSEDETLRRNLLLLADAFPRAIGIVDSTSLSVTYANATVVDALPVTPGQFRQFFELGLTMVITVFLGFFGVFASLLVTAGVIPRTFEAGEISLLLSKPVSRSVLFLTRFVGGCAFTLLYAAVLVTGLWLLLGLRIDYWKPQLLWCIPVYVLLFMIYYSVSAVAGAIWRNSIVSLSLVVCFWFGITIVGAVQEALQMNLIRARAIREVIPTPAGLLVVDGSQRTMVWDDGASEWEETFRPPADPAIPEFARRIMGSDIRFLPVWDPQRERLLALHQLPGRFGGLAAPELQGALAEEDWERIPLGRLPDAAHTILLTRDHSVLIPAQNAILEFAGQTEDERQRGDFLRNLSGGLLRSSSQAFRNLEPDDYPSLSRNFACAIDSQTDDLLIYDQGVLLRLQRGADGRYETAQRRDLETDDNGVLSVAGTLGLLALADGRILIFDRESLATVQATHLPDGVVPRVSAASPDGTTLGVLTHEDTVLLFDGVDGERLKWTPPEDGTCTALAFGPEGQLLVSNGRQTVREYDVASGAKTNEWAAETSWVYQFHDLVIVPLWTILPRPAELDQFVPFVMSGEATIVENEAGGPPGLINRDSLEQDRRVFDWRNVLGRNAAFVACLLLIGCLYIARRDF